MYKLKTVDVWDTLLRRKCHPEFSKIASARILYLKYIREIDKRYDDYLAIYRERSQIEAELAAESAKHGEYEIQAVLTRLLERVLIPSSVELSLIAAQLARLELTFELRHTFPDREFLALCNEYPAESTLFLSDFYMSSDAIKELLSHNGLREFARNGFSSCDVGFNKRTGTLFKYIHETLNVSPVDHVHIGDNLHADVNEAKRLGITAVHFQPIAGHEVRRNREIFLNNRDALFAHVSNEVQESTKKYSAALPEETRSAFDLGTRVAPLFIGLILYVAERSLQDQIQRLFFFTREGELFIELWRTLFPAGHLLGQPLPQPALLEVSRVATFCASLREISTDEMMRLWSLYSTQSLQGLFNSLGLEPRNFEELCRQFNLNLKDPIAEPWSREEVQQLFDCTEFKGALSRKARQDREILLRYLEDQGWNKEIGQVGVVDIGWRGTIQDNLAWIMPSSNIHGYYLGLQRFLNPQPINTNKSAFGPNANLATKNIDLLDAVSLIEMLCNSANGSVTGYQREASGTITANRIVDDTENHVHYQFVRHFQLGVLEAASVWSSYIDSHVITSDELRIPAIAIWRGLIRNKDFDLSSVYASLTHNEIFGAGEFIDKRLVPSPLQLLKGIFNTRTRREVVLFIRQTQWPAGVWARRDLGFIHRMMLVAALHLARLYKRLSYRMR